MKKTSVAAWGGSRGLGVGGGGGEFGGFDRTPLIKTANLKTCKIIK